MSFPDLRLSVVFVLVFIAGCGNSINESDTSEQPVISDTENVLGVEQNNPEIPDSISPSLEPIKIGYAGQDPANIARYLLASGAGRTQLSPDGKTVAFSYSVTGQPQLWTIALEPVSGKRVQARQLTFGNGVTFFHWSPDSQFLIYGVDNNGNEQESFYSITLNGESERMVLPAVKGGFRVFGEFSEDGNTFAYASTERNGLDFDIYLADSKTGDSRLVYEGTYGFSVESISPDGNTLILGETVGEDSDNLYSFDITDNTIEVISRPDPRANHTDAGVAWNGSGNSLYFATNRGREYTALVQYDLKQKITELVFETDADVEQVNLCGKDDRYLVWTTNHDGFSHLHARARLTGEVLKTPSLKEGVYQLSCASESARLAVKINGWSTPGDIDIWNMETGEHTHLFESNLAGLNKKQLIRPKSIRITARDGVELQGLLYLPEGLNADSGPPPVVFSVHGGPTAQSRPSYKPHIQYYVDQGIAVFETNVRGSTGFGRTYTTLDDREKRLDSVRDLIDMLEFLQRDGRVDTTRAAVMGGSYGGYMVNAVLAGYPGSFKAGVSLFGVADWVTALEIASPGLKASDLIEYGDIKEEQWREFYKVNSPIRQADRINVPILYSHGVMDPRVDIAETETMVRALRKNGIEAPFIRMPDEGHGWRKLSNRLFYYRREVEFLEKHLMASQPLK